MLLSTTLISFVTFFTSVTIGQQIKFGKFWDNLGDSKWFKESSGTNDVKARASRYDWTGTMENPECPGNVLSLHPGEGTRITSHKSYGKKAYPDNYKVRYSQNRDGALSLNSVVPKVVTIKIAWFHCIKYQKFSGSIAPFSKIEWFHGTTGTTTNASPVK